MNREGLLNPAMRTRILRANGIYLMVASIVGFLFMDLRGLVLGAGPVSLVVTAPYGAIGFVEAHGLAFIFGVLFWRAEPLRAWHVTALAVEALLGGSNLVFWELFTATGTLAAGYVFTSLHGLFVVLQLLAARASPNPRVLSMA
jgi:hypothetical protein